MTSERAFIDRKIEEEMLKLLIFQVKLVEFEERIGKTRRNILYIRLKPELKSKCIIN